MTTYYLRGKTIVAAAVLTAALSLRAADDPVTYVFGETDKSPVDYAVGEEMRFTLSAKGPCAAGCSLEWVRAGDDGVTETNRASVAADRPVTYRTKIDRPGFVSIVAKLLGPDGKPVKGTVPFRGGAGASVDTIAPYPEPADFDAFWAERKRRLAAVPMKPELREVKSPYPELRVWAFSVPCAGPRPATGYLCVPVAASAERPVPIRMEVGGYGFSCHNPPKTPMKDRITINVNAHGMKLPAFGGDAAYYERLGEEIKSNGHTYAFDPAQNADPDTAYFMGMAYRLMRALQFAKSRPEWNRKDIWVAGGSQGGFQTLLTAGLDPDVTEASPSVPWCCDIGGSEYGRLRGDWYVRWTPALGYFDPVHHARRMNPKLYCDVTRAGLGDYTCPPSGIAALYNALPCRKRIAWTQNETHGYVQPADRRQLTVWEAPAMPQDAATQEEAFAARLPEIFAKSAAHYRALDAAATASRRRDVTYRRGERVGNLYLPHGFKRAEGKLDMRSVYWWTAGHFPGSLWYLYEATGDAFFRDRATDWTELLAPNAEVTDNHDVGFIMYCSYGNARRLLKTKKYDGLLSQTADSLCERFNEKLGLIRSWGAKDGKKDFQVIPDNLMNLELLEWAAKSGTNTSRRAAFHDRVATSHADVTMRHHYRADGGCYHVLDYDQETGRVKGVARGQGASCETAWSRGQSWSIYGYAMLYRHTGLTRYLDFARKLADFAINHPNMPRDGVPYWDYGAPGEERDSSAAAIMACGLLDLAAAMDRPSAAKYRAFAVKQLASLASDAYFSKGDEIGHFLLKHGTGHKPARSEIDTPLDYGDYYFLEALLKLRELRAREAALAKTAALLPARAAMPKDRDGCGPFGILTEKSRNVSIAEAPAALAEPIPDVPDADYLLYWSTGNRTRYQNARGRRLSRLCSLALAEAAEGRGRYLKRIEDYLNAVCDMRSWVLPAHDWGGGARGAFDGRCPTVDLGASLLAADLADVLDLVGARLDPAVVARVKREAERRVFGPVRRELRFHPNQGGDPSLCRKFHHWWIESQNNWNAVCWHGLSAAALGLLDDPLDRALFVEGAVNAVPQYVASFTDDGYCSEGMGYWNYGFGHFLQMGMLFRQASGGKIDVFVDPKLRRVGAYARGYTLRPGASPSFADGCGAAAEEYLKIVDRIWPDLPKAFEPVTEFPAGCVWLLRDPNGLSVAFKGGHNDELHNHNDVGSYYVMDRDSFIGGDAGSEEYTRFTFSPQRYESKIINSYGHPVPVVGGKLQSLGRKAAAKVVSKDLAGAVQTVALDLTSAYDASTLKSLVRTFAYDRAAKTFTVRDRVEFSQPTAFESAFNTYRESANTSYRVGYGREKCTIGWDVRPEIAVKGGAYELAEEDIPNPNRISPRRVAVRFKEPVRSAEVTLTYRSH